MWTDFLTTDGNKLRRDRDGEFELKQATKAELLKLWKLGWECALRAIDGLSENDLTRKVTIRGQECVLRIALVGGRGAQRSNHFHKHFQGDTDENYRL